MTTLVRGRPLTTREPRLDIDAGLAAGTHRFQLEVIDGAGLRSRADVASVVVQRPVIVRPPLPPVRPGGPLVDPVGPVAGPPVVIPVTPVVRPVGGTVRPAGAPAPAPSPPHPSKRPPGHP